MLKKSFPPVCLGIQRLRRQVRRFQSEFQAVPRVCGAVVTAAELPEVSGAELESVETVWEGMTNSGTLLFANWGLIQQQSQPGYSGGKHAAAGYN